MGRYTFPGKMSIKETVGRYEGPVRTSNKYRNLQTQRIADDEEMAIKLAVADKEWDVNEKAKWAEKLEEKTGYQRAKNAMKQCEIEVKAASKASITVRRRALEVQMEKETAMYNQELCTQGKTFHKQRI